MDNLSNEDLAWAAGIFDGEGCIGAYKNRQYIRLKVEVNNTDPRMPLKLHSMFGGSLYLHPPYKDRPHEQQLYRWCAMDTQAGDIIAQIYPYLTVKKEQAAIALEFCKTYVGKGKRLPPETFTKREKWAEELKELKWPSNYVHLWEERTGKTPDI
jgi:hypothetical protein